MSPGSQITRESVISLSSSSTFSKSCEYTVISRVEKVCAITLLYTMEEGLNCMILPKELAIGMV